MTIASAFTLLSQDITAARTAITTKGGTVTANGGSSQLATDIATIPSGGSTGKYQLLDRVKTDSNVEIGTVSGFFTDANNTEYAVVCLDANYRLSGVQWASETGVVTNMPVYKNQLIWSAKETATQNTSLILASKTSTACSHCRSKSFVIGGTIYYGQLPNVIELINIFRYRAEINNADTSGGTIVIPTAQTTISSNQNASSLAFTLTAVGRVDQNTKTNNYLAIPVLEIPNAV